AIAGNISTKWLDWIGTLGIIALVCWQYGGNLFKTYGYTASDMLVHNYWVNAMCDNEIFVAGVYPYGFHCILYYFHAVFGIETYVLLRVFSLLMTFMIHFVLLFFLRLVCKTESAAYIATGFYILLNIWGKNAYFRYYGALPQEYGMIFILPSLFFLILFLREREEEKGQKGYRIRSTTMLKLFAMNVSMTLAAHFYDTIALGIFCVAIGIVFCRVIFRKAFFGRIMIAGITGLLIAILPMWFAYVGGTPLEGSLRWGMSVMQGKVDDENAAVTAQLSQNAQSNSAVTNSGETTQTQIEGSSVETNSEGSESNSSGTTVVSSQPSGTQVTTQPKVGFLRMMMTYLSGYVFISPKSSFGAITLCLIVFGFAIAGITLFQRETELGRVILAAALNLAFLCLVIMSKELGVPALMDKNRCASYFAYFLMILLGTVLDRLMELGMSLFEGEVIRKVFPIAFAVTCFIFLGLLGWVRMPVRMEAFQKNGAILCVTNILRENKPYTFNIVSANDELRMIEEYGYHVEASDLLLQNKDWNKDSYYVIPSQRVYVFIEKIPSEYDEPYEGSGKPISVESASKPLPLGTGIEVYKGEKRHVIMSKLYYWAKAFSEMYENEMSVYYEDDEFICYEIRQNVDRPYDMSFEFGYNN
ncbi:MAG: hypothetical protein J5546_06235, partial [Lachnospiraceae bacterium]|nr:hypothetical protein [Lachnospiraceae bacterium]